MIYAVDQPYGPGSKEGRFDIDGNEWFACDPYPTWFRWEGDKLILPNTYLGVPIWYTDIAGEVERRRAIMPDFSKFDPEKHNAMFDSDDYLIQGEINEHALGRHFVWLYNATVGCDHISDHRWSGIGCARCPGWYCS